MRDFDFELRRVAGHIISGGLATCSQAEEDADVQTIEDARKEIADLRARMRAAAGDYREWHPCLNDKCPYCQAASAEAEKGTP